MGAYYKANRKFKVPEIASIIRKYIAEEKNILATEIKLLKLPAFAEFIQKLDEKNRNSFKEHMRRYLWIYHPDCPFEINTTNRFLIITHEAAITARQPINRGQIIEHLEGYRFNVTHEEELALMAAKKDFSVVSSSSKGDRACFLGPARFCNHDCKANAKLLPGDKGRVRIQAIMDIEVGEEITYGYAETYFGSENQECLCFSCEGALDKGWAQVDENGERIEPEETPEPEGRPRRKRRRTNYNEFRSQPPSSQQPKVGKVKRRRGRKRKDDTGGDDESDESDEEDEDEDDDEDDLSELSLTPTPPLPEQSGPPPPSPPDIIIVRNLAPKYTGNDVFRGVRSIFAESMLKSLALESQLAPEMESTVEASVEESIFEELPPSEQQSRFRLETPTPATSPDTEIKVEDETDMEISSQLFPKRSNRISSKLSTPRGMSSPVGAAKKLRERQMERPRSPRSASRKPKDDESSGAATSDVVPHTYAGIEVFQMMVNGVVLMHRKKDSWVNATQILKVAGYEKHHRTRVLQEQIEKVEHEKVQGGYGKYQGTWVSWKRGEKFARKHGVDTRPLWRMYDHNIVVRAEEGEAKMKAESKFVSELKKSLRSDGDVDPGALSVLKDAAAPTRAASNPFRQGRSSANKFRKGCPPPVPSESHPLKRKRDPRNSSPVAISPGTFYRSKKAPNSPPVRSLKEATSREKKPSVDPIQKSSNPFRQRPPSQPQPQPRPIRTYSRNVKKLVSSYSPGKHTHTHLPPLPTIPLASDLSSLEEELSSSSESDPDDDDDPKPARPLPKLCDKEDGKDIINIVSSSPFPASTSAKRRTCTKPDPFAPLVTHRVPGDYINTPALLKMPGDTWVNCMVCEGSFMHEEAHRAKPYCKRCVRHVKVYGLTWPNTTEGWREVGMVGEKEKMEEAEKLRKVGLKVKVKGGKVFWWEWRKDLRSLKLEEGWADVEGLQRLGKRRLGMARMRSGKAQGLGKEESDTYSMEESVKAKVVENEKLEDVKSDMMKDFIKDLGGSVAIGKLLSDSPKPKRSPGRPPKAGKIRGSGGSFVKA